MTSSPFTKKTEGTRRKFLIIPPPNLQTSLPVQKGGPVPPPITRPGPTRVSLDTNSHSPQALHSVMAMPLFSESSNFPCYCIIRSANPLVLLDATFLFPLRLHFYVVFPWQVSLKGALLILCPFSEFSLPSTCHLTSTSFFLCPVTKTALKITDLQISKRSCHFSILCFLSSFLFTFLSSVSLEPLSFLCSYHVALIPSLVASLQAYWQMLFSAQSPHLEPYHSHSTRLPRMASHPSHLGSNFTSQQNLSILHILRLFSTIEVYLLHLISVYCLLNYCLSPPRGNSPHLLYSPRYALHVAKCLACSRY